MPVFAQEASTANVLIIGDSISIGYTPFTKELLKEKATVVHNAGNAGPTTNGLANIEKWLGETKWDVIHFNWGLHDLCYRNPDSKESGNRDKVNGTISTTLEQYEANLEELVCRLEETGAALIWANTTVVPEDEVGRFVCDEIKYNKVAEKIMKKHNIQINDLYTVSSCFPEELLAGAGNVHYKKDGYKILACQVATHINYHLEMLKAVK